MRWLTGFLSNWCNTGGWQLGAPALLRCDLRASVPACRVTSAGAGNDRQRRCLIRWRTHVTYCRPQVGTHVTRRRPLQDRWSGSRERDKEKDTACVRVRPAAGGRYLLVAATD